MDNAPYVYRSKGELRSALRWAQRVLQMRDWTFHFALDEDSAHEYVRKNLCDLDTPAACFAGPEFLLAWIGLYRDRAKSADFDPIFSLFHEMAHIAMYESTRKSDWADRERAATRIAWLLWKLWHKR